MSYIQEELEPLILISPKLLGIVDSTAKYVAKNGEVFEERIKREHKGKPKFSFLFPGDPFNAYYRHKVKELRSNLLSTLDNNANQAAQTKLISQPVERRESQSEDEKSTDTDPTRHTSSNNNDFNDQDNSKSSAQGDKEQDDHPDNDQSKEADPSSTNEGVPAVRMKLNEYILEKSIKLEEPPPLNYLATSAPMLHRMDCDIIKLTAQYIATYGRSFLLELVSKEQSNSQFDFLKPQHGQFGYMTNLIMQYALIQNHPLDIVERLNEDASSQKSVLDRMKARAEWTRMLQLEETKQREAEEREKLLYSQIDWHDFVIVETIDYQPEERGEYPPTTPSQVGTRLLLQQRYEDQNLQEEMEIDMDVSSNEDESENRGDEDSARGDTFAVPSSDLLPPKPDQVVIRRDYDPKASAASSIAHPDNYFVSPITNERIPVDKIHEHVRFNLADPRYLEKKDQMLQDKMNEEAVFASGSQIQDSLKSLAERRTDIFGEDDQETAIGQRIGEEGEEQQKDNRLIWDGHKSSLKRKKTG